MCSICRVQQDVTQVSNDHYMAPLTGSILAFAVLFVILFTLLLIAALTRKNIKSRSIRVEEKYRRAIMICSWTDEASLPQVSVNFACLVASFFLFCFFSEEKLKRTWALETSLHTDRINEKEKNHAMSDVDYNKMGAVFHKEMSRWRLSCLSVTFKPPLQISRLNRSLNEDKKRAGKKQGAVGGISKVVH